MRVAPGLGGWLNEAMTRPAPALILAVSLALAPPAAGEPEAGWPPGALISGLSGDWNGTGQTDLVLLLDRGDGAADLVIHERRDDRLRPVLLVPGAIFAGPMGGQSPWLEPRTDTSFVIRSEQIGIGRSPWEASVTVAHRGGNYVVAGYTHSFYDRFDPERRGRCDVNLLSGGWEGVFTPATGQPTRNRSGRDGPRAFPLADLTEDFFPQVCLDLFAE